MLLHEAYEMEERRNASRAGGLWFSWARDRLIGNDTLPRHFQRTSFVRTSAENPIATTTYPNTHPLLSLQALIGSLCNLAAAGLMKPQNVTTPNTTHNMLTM